MPSSSTACCSCGSYSRDVKPVACRRCQKSFLGLAKCAQAAAETRPGLMPQKRTRSPGARTSGRALRTLGGFGLGELFEVTRLEQLLETAPNRLSVEQDVVARAARLQPDDPHRHVPPAVAPRVALGLGERAQPSHSPTLGAAP